ncbi:MAG: FAD-dependent oxidoreductase [Candidatus Aenigmarchaeota archaeon]|nr:FAD-dependent oxidoreductase [Candidatus Aenigmarchaeota archaeon]
MVYDLIILGSGPAGLSAAVYSLRYNMKLLVIGMEMGTIVDAEKVDNYMGFSSISGVELAKKFTEHAEKLGAVIIREEIENIKKDGDIYTVKTNKNKYESKSIIYALGGIKRKLKLESEKKFMGKGISYCATCDAAFFKDKKVAVAGGGNASVASALHLSKFASGVYIIYRREKLRAFPFFIKKAEDDPKINIIYNSNIVELKGENKLESIVIENSKDGKRTEMKMDGVFVEFGYEPNSDIAEKIGVEITDDGRIKVNEDMSTNIKGFFAAGDVTTGSNRFNQLVTAAAEGAIASSSAYKYNVK